MASSQGMGGDRPSPDNPRAGAEADRARAEGNRDRSNPLDSRLRNKRYEKKKAKTFDATLENMMKLGGTVLGTMTGPVGTVTNAVVQGALGVDPMNPFGKPTGTTDSFSYDPKNTDENTATTDAERLAPPRPKKKKPKVTGMTLLEGAGGTLLGV